MAATKMVFHHMVLIFHLFKGFSDLKDFSARRLPDDFQEVFQTTSRKSSDGVLIKWFSSSTWICALFYRSRKLPDDFKEVFQTTFRKFSRRLPGSLLTGSSSISSGV
ncbi:hypothetical protein F2Q68_00008265 [Brassica cretica]|uniref:Uncharacterized protein n=1 Tax=Brassica cretica TaxID=69181 RepID=A0A8S9KTW3_BRACR|nr:hypothetical protein F2Q68_00008265 [Brassica cretica]